MNAVRASIGWVSLVICAALAGCGGGSGRRADVDPGIMPPGGSFTGVWSSPQYGEMHLVQNGTTVIGEYEKDQRKGKIQGGVTTNLLRFYWEEERELVQGRNSKTNGRGYFLYSLGDDKRHYIRGEWGIDHDEVGGGEWNAYRLKNRSPKLKHGGSSDREATPESAQPVYEEGASGVEEAAEEDGYEGVL